LARVRSGAETIRAEFRQQQEAISGLRERLRMEATPPPPDPFGPALAGAPPAQRLQALDADPRLNPFAQYERLQARQALAAAETASRSRQPAMLALAERRIGIAEQ